MHPTSAHSDRADAGHDLTLRQMPVADQSLAAVLGELVSMTGEQGCRLSLDRLHLQRSCAAAQNLRQRISKSPGWESWKTFSLGHGVLLLRWRSEGVEHPQYAALSPHAVTNFADDRHPIWLTSTLTLLGRKN
jgi:hypothetical protein